MSVFSFGFTIIKGLYQLGLFGLLYEIKQTQKQNSHDPEAENANVSFKFSYLVLVVSETVTYSVFYIQYENQRK